MGIILDIIIVAIIAVNIFVCYKKGLVKLAVGLIAVVAAIILAVILYKPVSNLVIKNTGIDKKIENVIIENFSEDTENGGETRYVGVLDYLEKYATDAVTKTQNEIVYETAGTLAVKITNIVVLLIIFIVVRAALQLLTFVSDAITSLPLIKQCNEVGGVLYGIVKALLIIYILLAIAFLVVLVSGNNTISDMISSSYITKFFYNNNILLNIIFK
mgnify:FL=1